jgi:tryptophan synthase beta subunit
MYVYFLEFDTVTDDHYVVTVSEEKFTKLYPQMMEEYNRKIEEEKRQKLKEKKKKGRIFVVPNIVIQYKTSLYLF